MKLSEDIKPISYLKSKTADIINSVQVVFVVQNRESKTIQDIKSYKNLKNKLFNE